MARKMAPLRALVPALVALGFLVVPTADGETWRRIGGVPAGPVSTLATDAAGRQVAAAAAGTVYLSRDGGRTWEKTGRGGAGVHDLVFLGDDPDAKRLLAVGEGGVRIREQGGGWRSADLSGTAARGTVRTVVAEVEGSGRLAFGTDSGIVLAEPAAGGWRAASVLLPGRVVDRLVWDESGALIAGSEEGLYRVDPARPEQSQRLSARAVRDVSSSGRWVLAALERGFLASSGGGAWDDLPEAAAKAAIAQALAPVMGQPGLFLVAGTQKIWRLEPGRLPEALIDAPPGEKTLVLLLLPGGRLLGGTDRGLYEAHLVASARLANGARRASAHAPEIAAARRLPDSGRDATVARRQPDSGRGATFRNDPDVANVMRAALSASHLGRSRLRRNFHGVRYRALFPALKLSMVRTRDSRRDQKYDQAFTSGALRHLYDQSSDRDRTRDIALVAEWDLGSLLFNPDELDVSEEARRVLTLRDDVLDEVNQIYFDRRRAIVALARVENDRLEGGGANAASQEATDLRIRIDELTASLDAWTNGYFSRERSRLISFSKGGGAM